MATITVRQAVDAYFKLSLGRKYRLLQNKHDRLEKTCVDVFAYYGLEISLDSVEKRNSFLGHILHMQSILKKLQSTIIKHPKTHTIEDVFPNSEDLFYQESNPLAPFIVKPRYHSFTFFQI